MALIFIGSSPAGTTENTSRFLEPLLRRLVPGISDAGIHQAQLVIRKTGHVVEYAILGALIWRARRRQAGGDNGAWSRREAALAVVLAALYAVTDELHQHFVPGRLGSAWDVLIDTLGAALGLAAVWAAGRWRGRW
jgi:VanZ family protein